MLTIKIGLILLVGTCLAAQPAPETERGVHVGRHQMHVAMSGFQDRDGLAGDRKAQDRTLRKPPKELKMVAPLLTT